jgi:hypothetical protein
MRRVVFVSGLILIAVGGILLRVTGLQRNWLVVAFGCVISIYAVFAKGKYHRN